MTKIKKLILLMLIMLGSMIISQYSVKANFGDKGIGSIWPLNFSTLKNNTNHLYCVSHGAALNDKSNYELKYVNKTVRCYSASTVVKNIVTPDGTLQTTLTCGGSSTANARDHSMGNFPNGHNLKVSRYEYVGDGTFKHDYKVKDIITINKSGTLKDAANAYKYNSNTPIGTPELNAKMAYVLANGNGYYGSFNGRYSQEQMAVYYYFTSFITPIYNTWGTDDADFGSINKDKNSIIQGAINYWKNLIQWQKSDGIFTDNTVKDNSGKITTTLAKYMDKNVEKAYLKVGPLNWEFPGDISEIHINNDSTPGIRAVLTGSSTIDICSNIIKSKTPFYLLIPADSGVNSINVKLKLKDSITVYKAEIILLESPGAKNARQNLIRGTGSPITVQSGDISLSYTLATGDITIHKRDAYNKTTPISGVTFTLKHKDTGLYVHSESGKVTYVTSASQATEFTTGQNGDVAINGIVAGQYIATESKITNASYTCNTGKTTTITVKANQNSGYNRYNKKNPVKIQIKGKVWTPVKTGKDEKSLDDNTANTYDTNKLLVKNIKVELLQNKRLKENPNGSGDLSNVEMENITERPAPTSYKKYDANGKEVTESLKTTGYTDGNGEYILELAVSYPELELSGYKVKFTYDGMDFIACATPNYSNKLNGSKALEIASQDKRTKLNNKYATITGTENNDLQKGYSRDANGNKTSDLTYLYDNVTKESKINNLSTGYDKDEITKRVTVKGDAKNAIEATYSLEAGIPDGKNPGGWEYIDNKNKPTTVQGINLALITRESPDLSVSNQIENVVTTINGYNNLYTKTLDRRPDGTLNVQPSDSALKVGVTYVSDPEPEKGQEGAADRIEGVLSNFTVYPSDVKTWADNSDVSDKLQVFVTYKVRITNESTSLYNKVKELAIYYDENYELRYIGNGLDENKYNYVAKSDYQVKNSNYSNYNININENEYNKACVEIPDVIVFNKESSGKSNFKEIYMTFKVKDDYIKTMLDDSGNVKKDEVLKMNNIVEINAYSTYSDDKGTYYAGVDKDSAAGNVNVNVGNGQIIRDDDTGIAREFNLSANKGDRSLTGTVFLDSTSNELQTGAERKGDSIYKESEDKTLEGVQVTLIGQASSSKNIVTGDLAESVAHNYGNDVKTSEDGNYTISGFIPGDYTLQYQYDNGTTYKNGGDTVNINTVDYKSAIVYDVEGQTKVKTAFTNGATDWYKLDNPQNASQVEAQFTRYSEAVDNWETRKGIDDKYKNVNRNNTGRENTKSVQTPMTATTPLMEVAVELNTISEGNTYTPADYNLINMDFGITERPRQQMEIEKEVSTVKITLTNDQVLLDAVIEDGELKNKASSIKVLPGTDNPKSRGIVDIELDNELIHGATLEIGYTMKAKNTSELDYTNEAYYKYGDKDENSIVKITPSILVDYVSNDLTYDSTNEINIANNWKLVNLDNIKDVIDKGGVLYTDIKGNDIKKENINTLLQSNYWAEKEVALAPGKSDGNLKLVLTKLLSNTDTDMTYDNDVELIGASKTGGRTIVTKIGEYTFDGGKGIGGSSEEVTITPPTGSTENTMIYYVIISVATIALIVGGIAFISIKRKK